jgi:hypothetical protein
MADEPTFRIPDHHKANGLFCRWSGCTTLRRDRWCPERCPSIAPDTDREHIALDHAALQAAWALVAQWRGEARKPYGDGTRVPVAAEDRAVLRCADQLATALGATDA